MTNDQQWHAPDSAAPASAFAAPGGLVPPASPPPAPPQAHLPPAPPPPPPGFGVLPGGAPGWTPPPKPGLIPLRPLTLGTILGAAFQTLRRNPAATLAPALILTMIVAVIQALSSAGFLAQYFGAVNDLGTEPGSGSLSESTTAGLVSGMAGFAATSLISGVLSVIVTAIIHGIVTVQVASSTLGSRLRLGGLWRRLSGRRGALIGWAFLAGIVPLLAIAIIGGLLFLLGSAGTGGTVFAVILGFVFFAGLAVVGIWLWVKLAFVPAAIVLERTSIRRSIARSWTLTRAAFWRIFGIQLLVVAMIWVATQIITAPVSLIFSLGGTILTPNGATTGAASNSFILSLIVIQGVTAVISAVGLVVTSATTSLLYLDRRIRLEGLDLDLAGYVERRQAGEQGIPDPYRTPGTPVGAV